MGQGMGKRIAAGLVALAIAGGASAGGPDPLANPGFAADLAGWSVLFGRPAVWSPLDAQAAADSGSARVTNVLAPSNGATPLTWRQCMPVFGGTGWLFAVEVFVPAGEPAFTSAEMVVYGHDDAVCGSGVVAIANVAAWDSVDTWVPLAGQLSLPPGVQSISINLGVSKPAGVSAPASAHFDQVVLEIDLVFVDSFDRTKV
jgi:hypothetical protein